MVNKSATEDPEARESSLVPAGFPTANFTQKLSFMKPLLGWGNLLKDIFQEGKETVEKLRRIDSSTFFLPFRQECKEA